MSMIDTKIYQKTFQYARENGELEVFRESNKCNQECATAIDKAVAESRHDRHFYNLPAALETVTHEFGLDRVAWVVAATIRHYDYDGRFSRANKDWAQSFPIPTDRESRILLNTHLAVLDGFADRVRKAHTQERAEVVQGYKILEATVFVNDRGFSLAENPDAPQPFVTWQFTETDSGRDYYWGHYKTDADSARQDFHSRVQEYRSDYDLAEKLPPIGQPGQHGYSAKFAEQLLDGIEDAQQRSLFSTDEKNLVCNYAFHTGDPVKTRQLAEELAAARFGMQYGGVQPGIAARINAEIAAIDERWARLDAASPIATVEMSTEQNYNQIDGVRNNMAVPPEEKPSVLEKIQEARLTPTPPKESHTSQKAIRGEER